mmetsp:Transcript_6504/g.13028  ORF Transcript_6504/g.13028 Transcript_6504/m.13028 type:complete len:294 (-) Transcript_6504:624-1505(-)
MAICPRTIQVVPNIPLEIHDAELDKNVEESENEFIRSPPRGEELRTVPGSVMMFVGFLPIGVFRGCGSRDGGFQTVSKRRRVVRVGTVTAKMKGKNEWGFSPPEIPDMAARYRQELAYVEEKYGPKRWEDKSLEAPEKAVARNQSSVKSYEQFRAALLADTVFLTYLLGVITWVGFSPRVFQSFVLGSGMGLLYLVLLSRGVDRLAEGAKNRGGGVGGDNLGPARLLLVAAMIVFISKNPDMFEVIPALVGFVVYKLAMIWPFLTGADLDPSFAHWFGTDGRGAEPNTLERGQ